VVQCSLFLVLCRSDGLALSNVCVGGCSIREARSRVDTKVGPVRIDPSLLVVSCVMRRERGKMAGELKAC